jgi:hypothetical protein
MKRKRTPGIDAAVPATTPDFDDDPNFYKDVYDCDWRVCESEIAYRLRVMFTSNGYAPKTVQAAPTHPIWIICAKRKDAPRIADNRLFFKHIQKLLRDTGFRLRKDEMTVDQKGDNILVSFIWKDSPIDYLAGLRDAEQVAAEFEEIPR